MRIAVDAKVLSGERLTGIGYYTYSILKHLAQIDSKNEYVLLSKSPIVHKINAPNFKEKILKFLPFFWSYFRLPFEFIRNKYDVLFVPTIVLPLFKRPKSIVVCHDLFIDSKSLKLKVYMWVATHFVLKRCDKIIAVSLSTKNDIIEKSGVSADKIVVIQHGYNLELYKQIKNESLVSKVLTKYGIRKKYIINTSSLLCNRKNLSKLIKAFKIFKQRTDSDYQLVITGERGNAYKEIINLIEYLKLKDDVILTGYVPVEDVPLLLNGAEVLVFTSKYEGFGFPILEAMACGCPVITSNVSSMPEVAGDAAILVNPEDENEIAEAIGNVLEDDNIKKQLREKGFEEVKKFSWEKVAKETLKVIEGVLRE